MHGAWRVEVGWVTSLLVFVLAIVLIVGTAYAAFWATYVFAMPLLAMLSRVRRNRQTAPGRERGCPSIAVIIPAHDMGGMIERCLGAVRASDYPGDAVSLYVVADHCTDDTVARATAAGATVLVRNDGPPGKTYSIAWALDSLGKLGVLPDLYFVTDATARIDRRFLSRLVGPWQRGEDIVVGHSVVDTENQQWFAQCLGLTLVHRNLQNAARERLGLSSLIEGRGMAYSAAYVRRHGWTLALPTVSEAGTHPTEDWRHGVRAVEHGHRVSFANDALVVTPLRETLSAATQQGVRWERGRMANAGTHGLTLLGRAVKCRNRLMIFAALDAIQPPVAILAAVCLVVAMLGTLGAGFLGPLARLAALPLLLVAIYGGLVLAQGRRDGIPARTVLWAPIYVSWRCYAFVLAWFQGLRGKAT